MIRYLGLVIGLLAAGHAQAQPDARAQGDNGGVIAAPAVVLGHAPGAQTYRDGQVTQYLRYVAARSDRVSYETIGQSHEGRPIDLFVITAPENHARLDEIRQRHLQLSDPESNVEPTDDMPVVIWLGYGIHGAEAAGLEASVPVMHRLATAEDAQTEELLRHSVILMVAPMNPDGHARRIDHSHSFMSKTMVRDPDHAGHDLWARQRANHYGYDLNRQWLLLAHPEPRAWMAKWHQWKPNLSADYHEMGTTSTRPTTYYFHPGEAGRTNALIPEETRRLVREVGRYHAQSFDEMQELYFTEELFDTYYIGTGSSYPQLNGSLGMLFEVGTAKLIEVDTPLGRRSLANNIEMHVTTALNTVRAGVAMRATLLDYQRRFAQSAIEQAGADRRGAFVFTSPDRTRLARFVDLLRRHDIAVHRLAADQSVGATAYRSDASYIVPLAQPQYRMIRTIFDSKTDFAKPIFYDVSGWTLPLAYNLEYDALADSRATRNLVAAPAEPVFPAPPPPAVAGYGYVLDWTDYHAPRALYRVLEAGLIARSAQVPITAKTRSGAVKLDRGAVFVPIGGQDMAAAAIHALMADIAEQDGVVVHGLDTGRTAQAGADFGSGGSFATLAMPRVLLLFKGGIQRFDMGHVWDLLDRRMGIPVTLKQKPRLGEIDWDTYTHIILPGGRGVGLADRHAARAARWIEEGGTFIGLRQGAEWAQQAFLGRAPVKSALSVMAEDRIDVAELRAREARDVIGGAIFLSDLDLSHPLAFGYDRRLLASHRDTAIRLATPDNPIATVARYLAESPVASGYVSRAREAELAGSPMLVAERVGDGTVILMPDNPNFRGAYLGTNRLLMNGLFLSKAFSTPRIQGGAHYRP